MSVKINYSNNKTGKSSINQILFVNEKFNINGLQKYLNKSEFSYIKDILKKNDLKKNLLTFELNSKKEIVLVSIKNNLKNSDIENLGAELFVRINNVKKNEYIINSDSISSKNVNFLGFLLHGLKLKSYEFKKYKHFLSL